MSRMQILSLLTRYQNESPGYRRLSRRLLSILGRSQHLEEMDSFLRLLQWTARIVEQGRDVKMWTPSIRLSIIWLHAHSLMKIFNQVGLPSTWVRSFFKQELQRPHITMFDRDHTIEDDISWPDHLHPIPLLLCRVFAHDDQDIETILDMPLRLQLLQVITRDGGEGLMFHPSLFLDIREATNHLGSFLRTDRRSLVGRLFGEASVSLVSDDTIDMLIAELEDPGTTGRAWAFVRAIKGKLPLAHTLRERVARILLHTNFADVVAQNRTLGLFALMSACSYSQDFMDQDLDQTLHTQILRCADTVLQTNHQSPGSETHQPSNANSDDVLSLIEACFLVCQSAPTIKARIDVFTTLLQELMNRSESCVPPIRKITEALYEELPATYAALFWQLLLRIRATA